MNKQKIALLEVGNGHIEVLYTQIYILCKSNFEVHLIVPQYHKERVMEFDLGVKYHFIADGSKWERFKYIRSIINDNNLTQVVINTAHWGAIKYLPFMLFKTRIIGVVHRANKLDKSFFQKLLSLKIKNYFVLSRHLYERYEKKSSNKLSYFYASIFPSYEKKEIPDKKDQFWISIPGGLEYKRRDYATLIKYLDSSLDKRIKFLLLGNCNRGNGLEIKKEIEDKGIEEYFIFFDSFVDDALFHTYLQSSDCMLPLVAENGRYFNSAISGAFNLAFTHTKVQLLHQSYQDTREFKDCSLFYEHKDITSFLNTLLENQDRLLKAQKALENDSRFSFEQQQKNYLKLIEQE